MELMCTEVPKDWWLWWSSTAEVVLKRFPGLLIELTTPIMESRMDNLSVLRTIGANVPGLHFFEGGGVHAAGEVLRGKEKALAQRGIPISGPTIHQSPQYPDPRAVEQGPSNSNCRIWSSVLPLLPP